MFGTDDMTFCTADCAMKDKCYRNPALIKEPQYPHSFADFSKNCMAYEPKDEPQTEYDKGWKLFADILFDKNKSNQFLEECKAMGIEPQTERSE